MQVGLNILQQKVLIYPDSLIVFCVTSVRVPCTRANTIQPTQVMANQPKEVEIMVKYYDWLIPDNHLIYIYNISDLPFLCWSIGSHLLLWCIIMFSLPKLNKWNFAVLGKHSSKVKSSDKIKIVVFWHVLLKIVQWKEGFYWANNCWRRVRFSWKGGLSSNLGSEDWHPRWNLLVLCQLCHRGWGGSWRRNFTWKCIVDDDDDQDRR